MRMNIIIILMLLVHITKSVDLEWIQDYKAKLISCIQKDGRYTQSKKPLVDGIPPLKIAAGKCLHFCAQVAMTYRADSQEHQIHVEAFPPDIRNRATVCSKQNLDKNQCAHADLFYRCMVLDTKVKQNVASCGIKRKERWEHLVKMDEESMLKKMISSYVYVCAVRCLFIKLGAIDTSNRFLETRKSIPMVEYVPHATVDTILECTNANMQRSLCLRAWKRINCVRFAMNATAA